MVNKKQNKSFMKAKRKEILKKGNKMDFEGKIAIIMGGAG